MLRLKEKSFLKQLVCEKKSKKICFPTDNYDSLFTLKNIFNSLHAAHPTCGPNPCQEGRWPWLSQDGFYRCLPTQKPIKECNGKLLLVKGFLKCNILDLKFSSGVHSTREACRGNLIFSPFRQKCVSRFRGRRK